LEYSKLEYFFFAFGPYNDKNNDGVGKTDPTSSAAVFNRIPHPDKSGFGMTGGGGGRTVISDQSAVISHQ
jgi:hypothetical protein